MEKYIVQEDFVIPKRLTEKDIEKENKKNNKEEEENDNKD